MDNALIGGDDLSAIAKGLLGEGEQMEVTPTAVLKAMESLDPDGEAYAPLENNEIKIFLEQANEGQAIVEIHGLSEGNSFCATLDADQVKEAVKTGNMDGVLREHFTRLHESGQLKTKEGQLRESRKLREDDDFGTSGGNDFYGSDNSPLGQFDGSKEFLPLGNAPFNRQLYIHDQWDMQAKAFYARTHDPVAKRALSLIVDFTLGRSVKMVCGSPLVQEYLEKFDKRNKLQRMLPVWIEDQGCDGELFFRFFDTEEGPPKMITMDASSIWEIVTDVENITDVKFYWQQYQTAYQLIGNAPVSGDGDVPEEDRRNPTVKYIIRYVPADKVLHFKINASAVEKRGRSDLYPVLGWLYRLRKYYDAETIKSLMQAAFVFDILLKGGAPDAAAVKNFSSQVPPPDVTKPGSAFYHNEGVEIQLLQGNKSAVNSTGAIGIGDGLLGIIAIGMGFAKDYLGVTSRGSRATALVSTEPSAKHFEGRQKQIKYMLEDIAEYVINYGIAKGDLPARERVVVKRQWRKVVNMLFIAVKKMKFGEALQIITQAATGSVDRPLDKDVAWIFPDIVKADRTQLIKDIQAAEASGYFSKRRAADLVSTAFEIDDYDFDEEQQDIAEEGETPTSKEQEQVAKGIPQADEVAWGPGSVANPAKATVKGTPVSKDNNGGASQQADNPQGNGSSDIRKDLGPQQKESIRIVIK